MSKKGFKKRLFASIFSFYFIAFQFFMVPSALAFGPSFDLFGASWEPIQKILNIIGEVGKGAFKTSVSTALSYFLQTMAKDVATGIVSGSVGQEPLFRVETFSTTLKKAADNATGVFLDDLSERGFDTLGLCEPISIGSGSLQQDSSGWLADKIKDLIDTLNIIPDFGEYDLTNKTPTCTFNKILETAENNIKGIFNYYIEYLLFDFFEKRCDAESFKIKDDFVNLIGSMMNFSLGVVLNPLEMLPSGEELAGAMESLNKEHEFSCDFFVCNNGGETGSCVGEDVDWKKTSGYIAHQALYSLLRDTLQIAFGDADLKQTPEETLKYQIKKSCKEMAEGVDDNVVVSMMDSYNYNHINRADLRFDSSLVFELFNDVVKVMDPYYIYPDKDLNYLDHFKKCVYVAKVGEDGPTFLTSDKDGGEKDCWIGLKKDNKDNIKYNNKTLSKINTSNSYKEEIRESLAQYCVTNAYEGIVYLPQKARQEYAESLERIRKANEARRATAEKEEELKAAEGNDIKPSTEPIANTVTTTSTQNTQMVESYQTSMQNFLTPTGDVFLDAAKLFLSTLLQGYFDELKKGIFQLPENFAQDDFLNFFKDFENNSMMDQINSASDWFGDDNWGEALIGIPKTGASVNENCIMDSNCISGLCDFVGDNKVCVECDDEGYKCGGSDICHENKCVKCVVDSDCETGSACSLATFTCEIIP